MNDTDLRGAVARAVSEAESVSDDPDGRFDRLVSALLVIMDERLVVERERWASDVIGENARGYQQGVEDERARILSALNAFISPSWKVGP